MSETNIDTNEVNKSQSTESLIVETIFAVHDTVRAVHDTEQLLPCGYMVESGHRPAGKCGVFFYEENGRSFVEIRDNSDDEGVVVGSRVDELARALGESELEFWFDDGSGAKEIYQINNEGCLYRVMRNEDGGAGSRLRLTESREESRLVALDLAQSLSNFLGLTSS